MNAIVDQGMIEHLVLFYQDLDNFLRGDTPEECAHCMDFGI